MKIIAVASAIPETIEHNDAVESRLHLEPGWIERRTGILGRPIALPTEATSDLAVRAGSVALKRSGIEKDDIGLLLLATSTPDHLLPPTAPLVAHRLGLAHSGAVDLAGACAGFLYSIILANAYGQAMHKPVLVIAANILTRRLNDKDSSTVALFSDGAGAVVLLPSDPSHFLGSYLGSDGSSYDTIGIAAGGTREPLTPEALMEGRHLMTMRRGSSLFKEAVHAMSFAGKEALIASGHKTGAIDWWIPHQANSRIIHDTGKLLDIPPERTINVVGKYGNSSAATIPIALADALETGRILPGNILLFTAAGAGMVSAGLVLRA
jgi:3-oxoacyl-[acyl-carrier-protein] synthase III